MKTRDQIADEVMEKISLSSMELDGFGGTWATYLTPAEVRTLVMDAMSQAHTPTVVDTGAGYGVIPPGPDSPRKETIVHPTPTDDLTDLEKQLCPKCGWYLSGHIRSQYGLDCPGGQSPSARNGRLSALRDAARQEKEKS